MTYTRLSTTHWEAFSPSLNLIRFGVYSFPHTSTQSLMTTRMDGGFIFLSPVPAELPSLSKSCVEMTQPVQRLCQIHRRKLVELSFAFFFLYRWSLQTQTIISGSGHAPKCHRLFLCVCVWKNLLAFPWFIMEMTNTWCPDSDCKMVMAMAMAKFTHDLERGEQSTIFTRLSFYNYSNSLYDQILSTNAGIDKRWEVLPIVPTQITGPYRLTMIMLPHRNISKLSKSWFGNKNSIMIWMLDWIFCHDSDTCFSNRYWCEYVKCYQSEFQCYCKLAVLPGARLHNSRFIIAELQNPCAREHVLLGSVWPRTECRPRAQQGLGARSACGGCWLVPAAADVAAITVISTGPAAQSLPLPTPWPQIPVLVLSLSSSSFSLSRFTPSFSLFSCSFCCLSLDFRASVVAGLRFW